MLTQRRQAGVIYEYIYLDDLPIAFVYNGEPGGYQWGQKRLFFYHTDHLGMKSGTPTI